MTRGRKAPSSPEHYWLDADRLMGGEWAPPHLDWLESQGITVLINLTERPYLDDRFQIRRIALADGAAPDAEQIRQFCAWVDEAVATGSKVYVHCAAGCGRTGTLMACWLVYRHRLDPREALRRVREARACSVETAAQADAVVEWGLLMDASGHRL